MSVGSAWKLQIKIQIGKFSFSGTLENVLADEVQANNPKVLPVSLARALYLKNLPLHHEDPFDPLLIAQAIVEDMSLVSADPKFSMYQAKLLW